MPILTTKYYTFSRNVNITMIGYGFYLVTGSFAWDPGPSRAGPENHCVRLNKETLFWITRYLVGCVTQKIYKVIIHYYLRLLWSFHSSTHCDSGHNVSKWDMNPSFWLMRLWISKQNLNAFSSLSQDVLLWAKSKCYHLCLGLENAEKKIYKLR